MDPFSTDDLDSALPETAGVTSRLDQEAANIAREKGWAEPEKYDYSRYAGPAGPSADGASPPHDDIPWASDARKYEWKEEYGDVGPEDEELEKILFRNDFINRAGVKFEK